MSNKQTFWHRFLKLIGKGGNQPTTKAVYIDGADVSTVPSVTTLTTATETLSTDTAVADFFTVTVTRDITIVCTNGMDGKGTTWLLTQGTGGSKNITLDSDMILPDSSGPLVFSTTEGKTDILAVKYSAALGKWLVVSMVPGY